LLFSANKYLIIMPLYEFYCEKCKKESEILVRSNDWKGTKCPHCGSTKLKKQFSTFVSKGTNGGNSKSCSPSCKGSCSCCH
ncbi:MAG: zinc ribbon domain-containing protein, partial [Verrucomicrobiae bacterium]|nr:zinc ribbon domain-containing protein [Verrucomicrobiae bacterium]